MRATVILALLTLLSIHPATALVGDDSPEQKVKEKRVVRVVTAPDFEFDTQEDFVFMGDGDHNVHIGAFGFNRGGFIGVQLVDLTPELRSHFGVPESSGVMISAVSENGPAADAGVQVADIITAVDGEEVASASQLARLVRGKDDGEPADLEVWRKGKVMTLTATIAERERPQIDIGQFLWKSGEGDELEGFAVHLDDLPENVIRIDQDRWSKALSELYTRFDSPEFKSKIEAMARERRGMEERIHELEDKLKALEEKLSKLDD